MQITESTSGKVKNVRLLPDRIRLLIFQNGMNVRNHQLRSSSLTAGKFRICIPSFLSSSHSSALA